MSTYAVCGWSRLGDWDGKHAVGDPLDSHAIYLEGVPVVLFLEESGISEAEAPLVGANVWLLPIEGVVELEVPFVYRRRAGAL